MQNYRLDLDLAVIGRGLLFLQIGIQELEMGLNLPCAHYPRHSRHMDGSEGLQRRGNNRREHCGRLFGLHGLAGRLLHKDVPRASRERQD